MFSGLEGSRCIFVIGVLVKGDRDGRVERRCGFRIRLELDRFKEYSDLVC